MFGRGRTSSVAAASASAYAAVRVTTADLSRTVGRWGWGADRDFCVS